MIIYTYVYQSREAHKASVFISPNTLCFFSFVLYVLLEAKWRIYTTCVCFATNPRGGCIMLCE